MKNHVAITCCLFALHSWGCASPLGHQLTFSSQPKSIVITRTIDDQSQSVKIDSPDEIREITDTLNRIRGMQFARISFAFPIEHTRLELRYIHQTKNVSMLGSSVMVPDEDEMLFYASSPEASLKLKKIVDEHVKSSLSK